MGNATDLDRIADERMSMDGYREQQKTICSVLFNIRNEIELLSAIAVSPFRQNGESIDDVLKRINDDWNAKLR